MLLRLLAAFVVIPLVELFLLLLLADAIGPLVAIGIVVLTGILGSILARREGVVAWYRFRSALAEGRIPSREIQDGLMIVFAAAMLLTPGLLTDAAGFLLLVPAGRRWVRRALLPRLFGRFRMHVISPGRPAAQTRWGESEPEEPAPFSRPRRDGYTIDADVVRGESEHVSPR